jgi:hypothetical protein
MILRDAAIVTTQRPAGLSPLSHGGGPRPESPQAAADPPAGPASRGICSDSDGGQDAVQVPGGQDAVTRPGPAYAIMIRRLMEVGGSAGKTLN